ncbi:MAG TPA: hypothetical protein VGC76_04030 [Pyrinomonadaceae bacterium]|jgi:hypothetical protein
MFFVKNKTLIFSSLISSVLFFAACPATPTTNVNTNSNLSGNTNKNANSNSVNTNSNASTAPSSAIDTREPDKYQATVKLKFETTGEQKLTIPGELQANVARSGENRRMEFNMPNGDKVIYLETGGKNLIVLPNRKQYAELNKETTGIDVRSMMTPGQIVNQVKSVKGVERVGEEKYADRDAIKYQYNAVTDTRTKAGNVETKSFIYVDKETNLPLHSETDAVASGSYQGIQGLKLITEMTNIKTDADAALFAEPTEYAKVQPEQVKQQVDAIFSVATAFITQLMKSAPTMTTSPATP